MDNSGTQDEFDFLASGPASTSGRSDAELLKGALMNERASPEVLQFETDLISRIEQNIDYQEEQIELLKEGDDNKLLVEIYMSELARVRYLLRAYLRTRLQKIERHVMHVLDNADMAARLSDKESQFARDYFVLFGSHMKAAAANHLPEAFSSLVRQAAAHPQKDMVPAPDLDRHVFCRVLEDRGNVTVDEEGNVAEFNRGDLFVIRYRAVQQLLAEGAVELVLAPTWGRVLSDAQQAGGAPPSYVLDPPFFFSLKDAPVLFSNEYGTLQGPSNSDLPVLDDVNMKTLRVVMQPCTVFQPGSHPNGDEVIFAVEGKLKFTVIDANYTAHTREIGPGDVVVAPLGYVHILKNVSCQPGTVHTVFDTSAPQRRDVGSLAAAIPAEAAQGAMGIDEEAWSQLEAGIKANGDTAIQPLGGDECRKRCGLE